MTTPEREKFEEYCINKNIDPLSLWGLSIWEGWQAGQPEIDAKNKLIDDLALQKGILKAEIGRLESENAKLSAAPATPRDVIKEALTPNQRCALSKGLSALETMASLWAADIRLSVLAAYLAQAPDETRANGIAAMIEQAFVEGAYRHYLDHKNAAATPPEFSEADLAYAEHDIKSIDKRWYVELKNGAYGHGKSLAEAMTGATFPEEEEHQPDPGDEPIWFEKDSRYE